MQLRLLDLDPFDVADLRELIPLRDFVDVDAREGAGHGDLGVVTAVVLVSVPAIRALAMWLSRQRRERTFEAEYEEINEEGTQRRGKIKVKTSDSETAEADVLRVLLEGLDLDPTQFGA